jgi:hypothetical protein
MFKAAFKSYCSVSNLSPILLSTFFKLWRLQHGYQSIYWLSWKPKMAKITTHEAAGKQLCAMAAAQL